ncbi:hypothetical protein RQN30_02120 [Arcanobacterium hippocoleae]
MVPKLKQNILFPDTAERNEIKDKNESTEKIIVMSMLLFGLMPASGAAAADSGSSEQKM